VKYTFALASDYECGRNPVKAQNQEFICCPELSRSMCHHARRALLAGAFLSV
jgi:hypothetical protein